MGFVYEHISVDQRAALGLLVAAHRGTYGLVTGLARDLGTSRQWLYRLATRAQTAVAQALAPGRPGPAPRPQAVVVDRGRLDRAIVTLALVGHASQRAIAACLDEAYQVRPSLGYINGVLARASQAAGALQAQWALAPARGRVAADELFVGDRPQLVAVDPDSLLLLALAAPADGRVDGAAWSQVFTALQHRGGTLRRVATDGGKALAQAVATLPGVVHQLDRWHALRHIGRTERALERTAYAALDKEWTLEQKVRGGPRRPGMNRAHPMGGYVWQRYEAARQQAAQAVRHYDDLCLLTAWARDALEAIDPGTGRVRSRQECLAEMQVVTALLRTLPVRAAERLATYLEGAAPGLLAYADDLRTQLAPVVAEVGEVGVRRLCHESHLQRVATRAHRAARPAARLAAARAHLVALLHWGGRYPRARARVVAVLDGVLRGSSAAECANSWVRPYADLLKGLGARLLPLLQLYRNAHVFARGKRAGHSPLELAGIPTPAGDWLDWLGLPRVDGAPPRRVRALPSAA